MLRHFTLAATLALAANPSHAQTQTGGAAKEIIQRQVTWLNLNRRDHDKLL
jgi:hypothetical protein